MNDLAHVAAWEPFNKRVVLHMVPELDPYYAEHAQPLTTAGEELDDHLDHDLSDLSVRGAKICLGVGC